MTEEILESYIGTVQEIRQLEGYLKAGAPNVGDVVQSAAEFPYSKHSVPISGADLELAEEWRSKLEQCKRIKTEVEQFVEAVPDARIRAAMRYKYYEDLPWITVALRCGWRDKDTPKENIKRFLQTC